MHDILSQGGDREPSPWPRRLAISAAPILVAVAGVVYLSLAHHQHAPVATPRTTATASQAPVPAGQAAPSLPPEPTWFSPASGRSEPLPGQVQTLDLATGRLTVVRLPQGTSAASGAFSPGGGFLALRASRRLPLWRTLRSPAGRPGP